MIWDRMGYILAETVTLLMMIFFTQVILGLRRGGLQHALFNKNDREVFFQPIRLTAGAPVRFLRYALIFILVTSIGALEIALFSQFGAAILTGVLLVTWTTIVYQGLRES